MSSLLWNKHSSKVIKGIHRVLQYCKYDMYSKHKMSWCPSKKKILYVQTSNQKTGGCSKSITFHSFNWICKCRLRSWISWIKSIKLVIHSQKNRHVFTCLSVIINRTINLISEIYLRWLQAIWAMVQMLDSTGSGWRKFIYVRRSYCVF